MSTSDDSPIGAHLLPDELYSRLTEPERYRIIGARVDAWAVALVERGTADFERGTSADWVSDPGPIVTRTDRLVPRVDGALPLVFARTLLGDIPDNGLVIGVGDPARAAELIPDCGCDACDSGSDDLLGQVDATIVAVVTGRYRNLTQGAREITVLGDSSSGRGNFGRGEWDAILDDPAGWNEVTGGSWSPVAPGGTGPTQAR